MKFKVKFKCDKCGEVFYNSINAKSRKEAKKYKEMFKNDTSFIHNVFGGGCEG